MRRLGGTANTQTRSAPSLYRMSKRTNPSRPSGGTGGPTATHSAQKISQVRTPYSSVVERRSDQRGRSAGSRQLPNVVNPGDTTACHDLRSGMSLVQLSDQRDDGRA